MQHYTSYSFFSFIRLWPLMFALRLFNKQLCDMHLGPGLPRPSSSVQVPYPTFLGIEDFVALFLLATYVFTEVLEEEWASRCDLALTTASRPVQADNLTSLAASRGKAGNYETLSDSFFYNLRCSDFHRHTRARRMAMGASYAFCNKDILPPKQRNQFRQRGSRQKNVYMVRPLLFLLTRECDTGMGSVRA